VPAAPAAGAGLALALAAGTTVGLERGLDALAHPIAQLVGLVGVDTAILDCRGQARLKGFQRSIDDRRLVAFGFVNDVRQAVAFGELGANVFSRHAGLLGDDGDQAVAPAAHLAAPLATEVAATLAAGAVLGAGQPVAHALLGVGLVVVHLVGLQAAGFHEGRNLVIQTRQGRGNHRFQVATFGLDDVSQ